MSFGARLRERREAKQLTQGQLGKGLGTDRKDVGKAVVYGWEKDQHFPRVDQLALLCERLDCSADYLLFGKMDAGAPLLPEVSELAWQMQTLPKEAREKFVFPVLRSAISAAKNSVALQPQDTSAKESPSDAQETSSNWRRVGS